MNMAEGNRELIKDIIGYLGSLSALSLRELKLSREHSKIQLQVAKNHSDRIVALEEAVEA